MIRLGNQTGNQAINHYKTSSMFRSLCMFPFSSLDILLFNFFFFFFYPATWCGRIFRFHSRSPCVYLFSFWMVTEKLMNFSKIWSMWLLMDIFFFYQLLRKSSALQSQKYSYTLLVWPNLLISSFLLSCSPYLALLSQSTYSHFSVLCPNATFTTCLHP